MKKTTTTAFHDTHAKDVLWRLREGTLSKLQYEHFIAGDGVRLAAVVEGLRNAYGFRIEGDGSTDDPYWLLPQDQLPSLVKTTKRHQDAYYETEHWRLVRQRRIELDQEMCRLCFVEDNLQVHHVVYRLFDESSSDLITVCVDCHQRIHEHCRLKFPSGISAEHSMMLGIEPSWEEWLLRGGRERKGLPVPKQLEMW